MNELLEVENDNNSPKLKKM